MSWASRELNQADLGDVRRNRRLVSIAEDLAASPESSVPLASRDRAALQGMSHEMRKEVGSIELKVVCRGGLSDRAAG